MKNSNDTQAQINTLIGKDVIITGWQYDNSGILLNGVITSLEATGKEEYWSPIYKVCTKDGFTLLALRYLKEMLKGNVISNKMLNSGTNTTFNPVRVNK